MTKLQPCTFSRYISCSTHDWNTYENIANILIRIKDKIGFYSCSVPILTLRDTGKGFEEGISAIVLGLINYITLHTYPRSNEIRVDVWSKEHFDSEQIEEGIVSILPAGCLLNTESKKTSKQTK
jgi:S-adenosylmethionine/arginine decarboxylase-like enzyme